jgi:coatomer subunit beta
MPFHFTQTHAHADDSRERMAACVKVLATPNPASQQVWLDDCRAAFSTLTSDKQSREAAALAAESAKSFAQPDDLIDFGHLRSRKGGISQLELEDQVCLGVGGWVAWCVCVGGGG